MGRRGLQSEFDDASSSSTWRKRSFRVILTYAWAMTFLILPLLVSSSNSDVKVSNDDGIHKASVRSSDGDNIRIVNVMDWGAVGDGQTGT